MLLCVGRRWHVARRWDVRDAVWPLVRCSGGNGDGEHARCVWRGLDEAAAAAAWVIQVLLWRGPHA